MMRSRIALGARSVALGAVRSTVFALCALIIPAAAAVLPVLAAFRLVGSPWSWSNPWSWIGLALIAFVETLILAHPVASAFRRLLARWCGIQLPAGYREQPEPVRLSTGFWWNGSSYEKSREDAVSDLRRRRIADPAYRRELRWAVMAAIVVAPPCAVPLAALVAAVVLAFGAWWWLSIACFALLLVVAPFAWRIVPVLAKRLLAPPAPTVAPTAELRRQRADLTAAHDAEIRRIERDLHDGAQSRLVAVGLDLAAAERLLETDPERALALLRMARAGTTESLSELRELVHGVYPPVLIERGLVPAIRALALDSPIDVAVEGPDGFRAASPLEAAAYFSVSELLSNIAKHARASRADIVIAVDAGHVGLTIRDDGCGGAAPRTGGGLDGIRRRLAAFDGTLDIDSPEGGPTTMTVRMPCESS